MALWDLLDYLVSQDITLYDTDGNVVYYGDARERPPQYDGYEVESIECVSDSLDITIKGV